MYVKSREGREALSAPGQGRWSPGRGLVLLGNIYFSLLRQSSPLAAPADARTTNESNITAAVAPVAAYLLFMVIAVKGFVNISSHPSLVKTDILTGFSGMPA